MNPSHRRMANLSYCVMGIALVTSTGLIFGDDSEDPAIETVASALNPANSPIDPSADRSRRIAFTHVQPAWPVDEDQRPDIDQADTDNYDSDDRVSDARHSASHQQRLIVPIRNEAFAEFHKRFMTAEPKRRLFGDPIDVRSERESNPTCFRCYSFWTRAQCSIIESRFGIRIVLADDPFADSFVATPTAQHYFSHYFWGYPGQDCSPISAGLPSEIFSPSQPYRYELRRMMQLEEEPIKRSEWSLEIFEETTWQPLPCELSSSPFIRRSIDRLLSRPAGSIAVCETEDEIQIVGVDRPGRFSSVLVYRLSRIPMTEFD